MAQNKLLYSFVMVLLIEACLYFFAGQTTNSTDLFGFILNLGTLELSGSTLFYGLIITGLLVFAGSQIIPGNFLSISPYAVYAGFAVIVLTYVANLAHFASFISGEMSSMDPVLVSMVFIFLIGPLALLYIMAVLEFARSNT